MEELVLALQGVSRVMEIRDDLDKIMDLIPEDKREEAEIELGRILGGFYATALNDGVELAAGRLEDRLRQVGLL